MRGAGSQFSTAPMLDDGYQILPSALSNIINLSLHNYRVQTNTVYPNPARDMLYIESGHTGNKEAEVMSLDGKLLLRHSSNASTVELSLVDLPSGLYMLKVKNLGSSEDFRIVVQ